jgi:DNA modification methylase
MWYKENRRTNNAQKMFKFMYETWAKDKKKEENVKSIKDGEHI